jgi:predicted RNase H-like HicB family nuclease
MTSYIAYLRKDADSDYGVEFPDLPGSFSAGSTLEEARAMASEALAGHVAVLQEEKRLFCRQLTPKGAQ